MMVCLILTHNVIRIYHKSCWRQLSYCGLHVRAVSVFGKKSDAVCGFLAYFCAVLRFSDPPLRRPPTWFCHWALLQHVPIKAVWSLSRLEPAWSWSYSKSLDLKEFSIVHVEYSYGRPVPSQVAKVRNLSIGEHRHCCVTFEIWGFVWEKTYRFCSLRKWKDFNKKQHTLLKVCVASVLCSPPADLWPCYRFLCKRFSL